MSNSVIFFVLAIIAISTCASVMRAWIKQRNQLPEPNEELEKTLGKIDALEERINVLERIITESRFDLKKEIDSL